MNNCRAWIILAGKKSSLITSISQQKDSTQQRASIEQASAKAHWLILQLEPIKSCEGGYGCRQTDDFGGENDAKHHEGWNFRSLCLRHTAYTARIESTNELI